MQYIDYQYSIQQSAQSIINNDLPLKFLLHRAKLVTNKKMYNSCEDHYYTGQHLALIMFNHQMQILPEILKERDIIPIAQPPIKNPYMTVVFWRNLLIKYSKMRK